MSTIYTEYLSMLPTDGNSPSDDLGLQVLVQLRKDLTLQLRKRGLWHLPPTLLGIPGNAWESNTLEELTHDSYLYIFDKRFKNLKSQLKVRDNVDGLVVLNLKHFLTGLQRQTDPVGYRVYEVLATAIDKSLQADQIHALSDGGRLCNDTVLGFRARTDPKQAAEPSELEALVAPGWAESLLPNLITARSRAVSQVITQMRDHILSLRTRGIEAFRFGDVVQPLKRDIRHRWAAVWDLDAGDTAAELDDAGVAAMVRIVHPDAYDDGRSLEWLLECVPNSIHQRQGDRGRQREGLWKLWEYLRGFTLGSDPSRGGRKLPSNSALGELLSISRERIPRLLKVLRALVEACREREGRPAIPATRLGASRKPVQWPYNDQHLLSHTERRATR